MTFVVFLVFALYIFIEKVFRIYYFLILGNKEEMFIILEERYVIGSFFGNFFI
jgi:hypothetical protein